MNNKYWELNKIEQKITLLNQKLKSNPIEVKNEIDYILENNDEMIKWYITKIELLKTKAKAFINLWEINEAEKTYELINNQITRKNYTQLEKENTPEKDKLTIEIIEEKLELYAKNARLIFDKNTENQLIENKEKIQEFKWIFEKDGEKLNILWKVDIALYNMWIFFYNIYKNEEAIKYIESAALLWNKKAIDFYTDFIIQYFVWNYNIFKNNQEKETFLEANLENIEELLFQFVNNYYKNENNKEIELIQWWNKYLYEKIWNFYSQIWLFSESLNSYTKWIQSNFNWSYKLYKNIAELYENFKYKIKAFDIININELIKDNYNFLSEHSSLIWDLENIIYWLEKIWDIERNTNKELSIKYYYQALSQIIEYNKKDKFSYISFTRLMEKLSLKELLLKYPDWDLVIKIEKLYREITLKFDSRYLLSLANYYDEIWNTLPAFQNYLNAFQANIENSKDALLIFLETSLKNFIEKEAKNFNLNIKNDNKILKESEIEYGKELNLDELIIKKQLLKIIIKNIDLNNKILREQIATLFDMSLWDNFYENFEYKELLIFIESYNQWINNADIYLHRILENLFSWNWTNINSIIIKELLKKIYTRQKLSKNDIDWIYNILNLENDNNTNTSQYTKKLIKNNSSI